MRAGRADRRRAVPPGCIAAGRSQRAARRGWSSRAHNPRRRYATPANRRSRGSLPDPACRRSSQRDRDAARAAREPVRRHQQRHRLASLDRPRHPQPRGPGKPRRLPPATRPARSRTTSPKPPAWRIRENALSARRRRRHARAPTAHASRSIPSAAADAGSNVSDASTIAATSPRRVAAASSSPISVDAAARRGRRRSPTDGRGEARRQAPHRAPRRPVAASRSGGSTDPRTAASSA